MTDVLGSRGIRRFGVLVAAVAAIMVVLAGNAERAEATSKWNSCASGVTCYGSTQWYEEQSWGYWARGVTQAYDQWGTLSLDYQIANIHGTNIYHAGSVFVWDQCGGYGEDYCLTAYVNPCDNVGGVCGSGGDHGNWYATTKSYFNDTGLGLNLSLYTATSTMLGRESSSCYVYMNCF